MATASNPANESSAPTTVERQRIPFSTPQQRLAVPDIPGYKTYWFRGEPTRIERALQAGYEFVDRGEVKLNNRDLLGSSSVEDGNSDLGTRVSIVASGELDKAGQPARLILMKIKEEWWKKDQEDAIGPGSRLDGVRRSVLGGLMGQEGTSDDKAQVYVDKRKTKVPEFFKRK